MRWFIAAVLSCAAIAGFPRGEAHAQATAEGDATGAFSFAVFGSSHDDPDRRAVRIVRAIDDAPVRFAVHFDLSSASAASCADAAIERRRDLLAMSDRPVVPVVGAVEWADCGDAASDPQERLGRIGDTFFGGDESPGRNRLTWLRQSAMPRFHRSRENLRWQVGGVLFATMNLPANNNNFRLGAGRNGEFEERLVANRAWIERTFRLANERHLAGVVLFVDAAPHFDVAMRAPDRRSAQRDGYYEWKLALREQVAAFRGSVLLVQARPASGSAAWTIADEPLRDAAGKSVANLSRVAVDDGGTGLRWMRITVRPAAAHPFLVTAETLFDDPSGELYGGPKSMSGATGR